GVGVQRVGLALAASCRAIRAADLGHLDDGGLQDLGQARAVTRRHFYSGDRDRAEAAGPRQCVRVAGWACRELAVCQRFPASVMAARWMVSKWVSAPMTTRGDAVTMVMSLLLVSASRWRHPAGRADN